MNLFSQIICAIAFLVLLLFLAYLYINRPRKEPDTRPEDVASLAQKNGWAFVEKSQKLDELIDINRFGYMGGRFKTQLVCEQAISGDKAYIFDCLATTYISGIALEFDGQNLPPFTIVERLIDNRLERAEGSPIASERLPKFVGAKVHVYAAAEVHDTVCSFIDENQKLQTLFKRRDIGYICLRGQTIIVYFLTKYPADERGFAKFNQHIQSISQIFE